MAIKGVQLKPDGPSQPKRYSINYPPEMIEHPTLGYTHNKNSKSRHIERTIHYPIFDATYSFDNYSRRISPITFNKTKYQRAVALFGCSFTYGNALNDNQTINHYINQQSENTYAYNYAVGAAGTNMLLATLQENNFQEQIDLKSDNINLVYVFISGHIARANAFVTQAAWTDITPKFEWIGSKLKNVGSIRKAEPIRQSFFDFVRWLYKLFGINGNFPPMRNSHLKYVCDLVIESQKLWRTSYPKGNLYFYIHPLVNKTPEHLTTCLKENKIPIIIGQAGIKLDSKMKRVEHDGHPSSTLNREIAKEILLTIE